MKRTPVNGKQDNITPEALRLWRLCREIELERAVERWEDDKRPGRRRQYLTAWKALNSALARPWFDLNPLDCASETAPDHIRRNGRAGEYREAWLLRQALEQADREQPD